MLLLLTIVGFDRLIAHGMPLGGSTIDGMLITEQSEQQFSLTGLSGLLGPLSRLSMSRDAQTLSLRKGSLLIDAAGTVSINIGDGFTVRLLDGSCLVLRDEHSGTVVALSAPALALRGDERWILPRGTQLTLDGVGRVQQSEAPAQWLAEQSAKNASLPRAELPAADPIASLVALLHSSDPLTSDALSAAFALSAVSQDSALEVLAAVQLAPQAERMDGRASDMIVSAILEHIASSELAFAVPALANSTLKILPAGLIAAWSKAAGRMAADDPVGSATLFHRIVASLPARYETAGYPKQAMLWRGSIRQVHVILSLLLTGAAAEEYAEDFATAMRETDLSERSARSSESAAPQRLSSYTSDQLTDLTRQFLLKEEVLLGASVSITVDGENPDCARVDGVFIAEAGHDVPYAFSYCPRKEFIRRIDRDSKHLPNDVPVDTFFH